MVMQEAAAGRRKVSSRQTSHGSSISQPGGAQRQRPRMARAVSGTVGGMLNTLRTLAMTPIVSSPQRRTTVTSHLPRDVEVRRPSLLPTHSRLFRTDGLMVPANVVFYSAAMIAVSSLCGVMLV